MPNLVIRFFRSPIQTIREEETLVKFALVGATGTLVNEALLYFLRTVAGLLLAQAIGVEVSIISNFIWNDSFTFRKITRADEVNNHRSRYRKPYRFLKYNLLCVGTFALNLATYTLVLAAIGKSWYILASLSAILVAFVFNYFGSSRWAWKREKEKKMLPKVDRQSLTESL
jgi:dolichol-phosphate mannosyltransferase